MTTLRPPGPRGHWLSGNLPEFREGRLEFLRQCARSYGDVVGLRFAHRRIMLVSHPDLIEEVLVTRNHHFIKHFALRLNPLLLGKGLLTSEGDFWLRQRRLVQPAFVRSRIAAYAPTMVEATLRLLRDWQPGQHRNVHPDMMKLTLDIAARTLFHADAAADEARDIAQAMQVLQESFTVRFQGLLPLPLWLPTPANLRLRRAVRRLDVIIYGFIRRRRQSSEDQGDLLSLLLHARDAGDGTRMTDRQVRDEAMTLFLAGHETTALTLSWTWYLLARHPQVEVKLLEELGAVLPDRLPVFEDVGKMRYAEAILLEAMRLYPPAYTIGREALEDTTLGGYPVRKGTTVLMSQWVVQRDPRFFDDPDEFRPERWLGDAAKKIPKFAYFPFGGGPRLCVGNTFALMEMALVLATLAPRYRFTVEPGVDVQPVPAFTLHPVPGIPAVITPREALKTTVATSP
jgi:cytochrome P450